MLTTQTIGALHLIERAQVPQRGSRPSVCREDGKSQSSQEQHLSKQRNWPEELRVAGFLRTLSASAGQSCELSLGRSASATWCLDPCLFTVNSGWHSQHVELVPQSCRDQVSSPRAFDDLIMNRTITSLDLRLLSDRWATNGGYWAFPAGEGTKTEFDGQIAVRTTGTFGSPHLSSLTFLSRSLSVISHEFEGAWAASASWATEHRASRWANAATRIPAAWPGRLRARR